MTALLKDVEIQTVNKDLSNISGFAKKHYILNMMDTEPNIY